MIDRCLLFISNNALLLKQKRMVLHYFPEASEQLQGKDLLLWCNDMIHTTSVLSWNTFDRFYICSTKTKLARTIHEEKLAILAEQDYATMLHEWNYSKCI